MSIFRCRKVTFISFAILAFANEGIDFTEEENAHFDVCRVCRLKVIDPLRNLTPLVVSTTMSKAA